MKRNPKLKILIISNIVLVILILFWGSKIYITKTKSISDTNQVVANEEIEGLPSEEIKGVEEEKVFTVSVCGSTSCVWISSTGLIQNGILDEKALYQKILDSVIPHFENKYGGKTFAKNRAGSFIYWKEDNIPDLSNIYSDIVNAFREKNATSIQLEVKDLPGTDGTYSNRYIEVDDSKLKLYAWVDGKVVREIKLSPAKKGYQVYGVFPIIDKGLAPIAPTGRYMPYWMAFYYSPKQNTYWGLHALIWWYDENGRKVYEPTSNIGVRRSGGCIRMLVEDAKFLYEIYEKGDPILIHE